jgi:hypothetical protein
LVLFIYLEKLNWEKESQNEFFSSREFLYILAFAIKLKISNYNMNIFNFFSEKLPEITRAYYDWMEKENNFKLIKITEKDLNQNFKRFKNVRK